MTITDAQLDAKYESGQNILMTETYRILISSSFKLYSFFLGEQ